VKAFDSFKIALVEALKLGSFTCYIFQNISATRRCRKKLHQKSLFAVGYVSEVDLSKGYFYEVDLTREQFYFNSKTDKSERKLPTAKQCCAAVPVSAIKFRASRNAAKIDLIVGVILSLTKDGRVEWAQLVTLYRNGSSLDLNEEQAGAKQRCVAGGEYQ